MTLSFCGVNAPTPAQARRDRKAAVVAKDKAAVVTDNADLSAWRDPKADDKMLDDEPAVRTDRKGIRKTDRRLIKDRVKTLVDKVKKAL